jgi:phosphatidyl-myo-inositol alpha-mannosyltransferase
VPEAGTWSLTAPTRTTQNIEKGGAGHVLKIGIVSEYYYPLLGGISEHVHNTAVQFSRMGHRVQVITAQARPDQVLSRASTAGKEPFDVIRLGRSLAIPWNGSVTNVTVGFTRLWHELRKTMTAGAYDIVHVHSPLVFTLPPLAILASPGPCVATFHSHFDKTPIYTAIKGLLQRHFLDKLSGQIAVSRSCVRAMAPYFRINPQIIPNGIDVDRFTPDAPRLAQYDDGRLNLLFLSRFEPRNGLDLMLRSFGIIRREVPGARLIVVGDGPRRPEYERLAARDFGPDVQIVGPVLDDRPSYYATADLYCAPISKASFGMTLLEAMACGRPIVATVNDGYPDLLGPEEGVLVPPHDHVVFAEAIVGLLKDPARRQRMGRAGRAKALGYNWPSVAERLIAYYQEILGRS